VTSMAAPLSTVSRKCEFCQVMNVVIHGPTSRDAKRKVLLPFPAVGNTAVKASDG
jgi:hypothetical protein